MAKQEGGGSSSLLVVLAIVGALAAPHFKTNGNASETPHHGPPSTDERSTTPGPVKVTVSVDSPPPKPPFERLVHELHSLINQTVAVPDKATDSLRDDLTIDGIAEQCVEKKGVRPIVISLPDPRQSHMSLYYDQELVALDQAAEALGYVPGRFYLPWQKDIHPNGDTDGTGNQASPPLSNQENALPGLKLFRKRADSLVLAILVTESPVTAASVPQLRLALQLARDLSCAAPVEVLGPFFSGSADSFAEALKSSPLNKTNETAPESRFFVLTGSATSLHIDEAFALAPNVVFSRTIPSDDALLKLVARSLWEIESGKGIAPKVAALLESGTGYGIAGVEGKPTSKDGDALAKYFPAEYYRFGIHISELRAEHERTDSQPELFPTLRRTLGLKFNPLEEHESDVPATLSSLTAYVDDLTLAEELTAICGHRVRYLVVQATDPVDIVFLAKESRKYCPDLTLIVLGTDELFTHPDLASTFSGVLVAGAYAPSFETLLFADGTKRSPFPNSVSQGFFNAAVTLMGHVTRSADVSKKLVGFHCATGGCDWQVYFSQVASSRLWPLRAEAISVDPPVLEWTKPDLKASVGRRDSKDGGTTSRARLIAWPVLFVALVHLVIRRTKRAFFSEPAQCWIRLQIERGVVADTSLLLIVALACLPFGFLEFSGVFTSPSFLGACWWIARIGMACVAALLISSLHGIKELILRAKDDGRPARTKVVGALTLFSTVALVLFASTWSAWPTAYLSLYPVARADASGSALPTTSEMLGLRLMNPFGMSPAAPLFCVGVGIYIWSLYALFRIKRLDRFPEEMPPLSAHQSKNPLWSSWKKMWVELYEPWSQMRYMRVVAVLVLFAGWRFVERLHPSFESLRYDVSFQIGFLALALLVAGETLRFLTLSQLLLEFARNAAAEPMVNAYQRIAQKVSGSFGLQFHARVPRTQDLQIAVLSSQTLAHWTGTIAGLPQAGAIVDAARKVQATSQKVNEASPCRADVERDAHAAFFELAALLHEYLGNLWKTRAAAPDLKQTKAQFSGKDLMPGGDHATSPTPLILMSALPRDQYLFLRLAEDFVALRIATFVYQVLHELRHTLSFALVGSGLLVASIVGYPFQPAHFLNLCVWCTLVVVTLAGLLRMMALERNELLSLLGGTKPDQIEWTASFVQQLFVYVGVPLIAAVVGLFPELGDAAASQLSTLARLMPASGN
jgi:hypothetical protein